MSALMADHRDFADEPRQPSLFDVLAQPSARPGQDEVAEPEGAQVVEFPRRPESAEAVSAPIEDAAPEVAAEAPDVVEAVGFAEVAESYVAEPAPVSPEDAWLVEIAPEVDEAEMTALDVELAPETYVAGEPRTPRAAGAPMAGPTLDDVMSRVWEGLAIGLPAACPVCHGEMLPAAGGAAHSGTCSSCGTTIE